MKWPSIIPTKMQQQRIKTPRHKCPTSHPPTTDRQPGTPPLQPEVRVTLHGGAYSAPMKLPTAKAQLAKLSLYNCFLFFTPPPSAVLRDSVRVYGNKRRVELPTPERDRQGKVQQRGSERRSRSSTPSSSKKRSRSSGGCENLKKRRKN